MLILPLAFDWIALEVIVFKWNADGTLFRTSGKIFDLPARLYSSNKQT